MNSAEKVTLTEEKETLLITLRARANDYHSRNSILHDKTADDLMQALAIDTARYKGLGDQVTVVRARQFDEWVSQFIRGNPYAVVLCLGCGLDTRIARIKKPGSVSWFDVDYPEVISLRKTYFQEGNGYQMIASSVTEPGWLEKIPRDRQVLIIAEGLLEYLTAGEVKNLFNRLTGYFQKGQMIFDVMNSVAIKSGRNKLKAATGAVHKWAVDHPTEIDKMDPKMKRIDQLPLFKSRFIRQLPAGLRILLGVGTIFPRFRNMIRLMRYRF